MHVNEVQQFYSCLFQMILYLDKCNIHIYNDKQLLLAILYTYIRTTVGRYSYLIFKCGSFSLFFKTWNFFGLISFLIHIHKISFCFPSSSHFQWPLNISYISDSQNGIPTRIIWETCKTCWVPDPICRGSDTAWLGINPKIFIFQMCPINSDGGGLLSTLLGNSYWSEYVKMEWKCKLTYCGHGYVEFPTLANIERW